MFTASLITNLDFPRSQGAQGLLLQGTCCSKCPQPQLILAPLSEPALHIPSRAQVSSWGLIPGLIRSMRPYRCQLALGQVARDAAGEQHCPRLASLRNLTPSYRKFNSCSKCIFPSYVEMRFCFVIAKTQIPSDTGKGEEKQHRDFFLTRQHF